MVPRYVRGALIGLLVLGALMRLESPRLDPAATLYTDLTDEGWWAASAVRAHGGGQLVLPGDYNPVLITPAWTALLMLVFAVAGPSLAAARVAAGLCGALAPVALWWALAELEARERALAAAALAVSFAAVAFSRMAILEAPMMLSMLLAVGCHRRAVSGGFAAALASAVAVAAAVLTKTSALLLVPVLLADAALSFARGASRGAAVRAAGATLLGACAWPAFAAWAGATYPADFARMAGANVSDKLPKLAELPSQLLWYLGFNQLLENAPLVMLGAWVAAGAFVFQALASPQDRAHGGTEDTEVARRPDELALFAALWFLAMAGAVAVLPYQPKRYHMLSFPPACVLTAMLCVRAGSGAIPRRALLAGLSLAASVAAFALAMARMRDSGAFVAQPTLHPDNAAQLLRDGLLLAAVAVTGILALARATTRPLRARSIMITMLALEVAYSTSAYVRWRARSTDSAVRASREVAALVRARPPARLAGAVAHTVALETGIEARFLSIEPRLHRREVPTDPLSHVILDDPRDLPIWQSEAPDLAARLQPAATWDLTPDWPHPVRWQLLTVAPDELGR